MKKILAFALGLMCFGTAFAQTKIPLVTGPQDIGNTNAALNNLINQINNAGFGAGGGGSVSITSGTANLVATPSPITGTGVLSSAYLPQLKSSAYAVLSTDLGTLILDNSASNHLMTVPGAAASGFGNGASFDYGEISTGTNTPSSASSILPVAAKLAQGQTASLTSDGTAWYTTNVSLPYAANNTIMANFSGSAGYPTALASGGGTTNFLRADGTWAAPGGGGSPGGSTTQLQYNNAGAFGGIAGATTDGTITTYASGDLLATLPVFTGAIVSSASATALTVGSNGATTPALTVDASTASSVSGIIVKSAATGSATTITSTDSGAAAPLTLNTKGAGNLGLFSASGQVNIGLSGNNNLIVNGVAFTYAPIASNNAAAARFLYTPSADLALTLSTNAVIGNWATATRTHATGALTLQTDYVINGSTDAFAAASALTDGATLSIAPKNCGTNGTCTNESGLYVASKAITGTVTNSFGINAAAATGPTNNYAARFAGDVLYAGTAPAVTGTGTPTIVATSTDTAGEVTSGATATSVIITFATTKPRAPFCVVSPQSVLLAFSYTISTTAITITQTATSGEKINYHCDQN